MCDLSSRGKFASKFEAETSLGNWICFWDPFYIELLGLCVHIWLLGVGEPNPRVLDARKAPCQLSYISDPFLFPQIFLLSDLRKKESPPLSSYCFGALLKTVYKLKCVCTGVQHSQSSLSYERNASSEWTLACLRTIPLQRDISTT